MFIGIISKLKAKKTVYLKLTNLKKEYKTKKEDVGALQQNANQKFRDLFTKHYFEQGR